VPGYYFPKRTTSLYHWNEATLSLDYVKNYGDGFLPYLVPTFRQANVTSSEGFLARAAFLVENGQREIAMLDSANHMVIKPA
jgi:hypothetical protein